jgi:mRNA interferase RelE/StbE
MPSLHKLVYSSKALAFLKTIELKLRTQIINKIAFLPINQFPPGHKLIRGMLKNEEKVYRIRSGNYRILYIVRSNPNQIIVLDIGHRKDIYR